jgi:hypothetical protein
VVETYLKELVNHRKYPYSVTQVDSNILDCFVNNAVWDIETGLLLKLDEDKRISNAVFGFTPLNRS